MAGTEINTRGSSGGQRFSENRGGESHDSEEYSCSMDMDGSRNNCSIDEFPDRRGVGYLICLTLSAGGLQVVWAAIMGQGSPFLSDLGIPAYIISLIWLAGPISGALVQPYISVLSDRSRNKWGRRRPFILVGAIFTVIPMILLPCTSNIVDYIIPDPNTHGIEIITLRCIIAGILIWIFNISIQAVQVGIRVLVVESCPPTQQMQATAYLSCITAVGSILGYTFGFVDLVLILPWLGDTQYKCVFFVASFVLISTVAITCSVIHESALLADLHDENRSKGIMAIFQNIMATARLMPREMKTVCKVQFLSWLGWFPFLFYVTTYLGSTYERELLEYSAHDKYIEKQSPTRSHFIRQGSMTMVIFAIVTLASNLSLPLFIPTYTTCQANMKSEYSSSMRNDNLQFPLHQKSSRWWTWKPRMQISSLTLPRAWAISHVLKASVLLATMFASDFLVLSIQISILGTSWAITQWAPLALMSTYISAYQLFENDAPQEKDRQELQEGFLPSFNNSASSSRTCFQCDISETITKEARPLEQRLQAGAVMGIYNVSMAAPQILAAVGTSCLLWMFGRLGLGEGEATGWVIRLGSLASLAAAWLAAGIESIETY